MGDRRIFRCKKCGRKFTPKHQQPAEAQEKTPPQSETTTTPASATA
jgi:transposase-like protein